VPRPAPLSEPGLPDAVETGWKTANSKSGFCNLSHHVSPVVGK
jgi:hypothetical protein